MKQELGSSKITFGRGEEICHNCGQYIRNIIWVDGVAYGPECGQQFLPKAPKTSKQFEVALQNQEIALRIETAHQMIAFVESQLPVRDLPTAVILEKMQSTCIRNSSKYIVWVAYYEARKMLS